MAIELTEKIELPGCDEITLEYLEAAPGLSQEVVAITMNNESIWIAPESLGDFAVKLTAFKNRIQIEKKKGIL